MSAGLSGDQIALYMAVMARVGGLVVAAPVLGDGQVPQRIKAPLILALSLALMSIPVIAHQHIPTDLGRFAATIVVQLGIGLAMGFIMRALFLAAQMAGGIVSLGTGLSTGAVLNPLSQEPDPIFMQFYTVVASLVFLAVDGEAWAVAAMARSFSLTPVSGMTLSSGLLGAAVSAAAGVALAGFMLALPVAASLFAANVVLGVLSRALPQLNVFILSLPIDLLLGLLALLISIAATVLALATMTQALPQTVLMPLAGH